MNYIESHDFGLGQEPEIKQLKKLNLRNLDDLYFYIKNVSSIEFKQNSVNFLIKVKV